MYPNQSTNGYGTATLPINLTQPFLGIGNADFGDILTVFITNTTVTAHYDTYTYDGNQNNKIARVVILGI